MTNRVSKQTGPTNLDEYDVRQRAQLLHQIIEGRLKAERTEFVDRQQIYDLAANSIAEAKDANTRAELELLKLLALANRAESLPNNLKDKSPYREWHRTHDLETIENGFGAGTTCAQSCSGISRRDTTRSRSQSARRQSRAVGCFSRLAHLTERTRNWIEAVISPRSDRIFLTS